MKFMKIGMCVALINNRQKHFKGKRLILMFKKFFLLSALGLIFVLALNGCGKKTEVTEVPKTEEITVALTPSTQEIRGEQFTLQLSNLGILKLISLLKN